jgi:putative nucleotidyltransferase with HDIG domain
VDLVRHFERVNRELWLVLSLFVIAAVMNFLVSGQRMVLAFYTLPTIYSAYHYGRRHATLTAVASVLMVVILLWTNPAVMQATIAGGAAEWLDITVWGGMLLITGYMMGTLYERKDAQVRELRETYVGVLMILRHFISNDKYTENHSYRVSVYATKIAAAFGLNDERIEDIRAAALLHDIGKLDISRELLYKAARLTEGEYSEVQRHVAKGVAMLEPVGGSLRRVLPIVLSHHDKFDGSGYHSTRGEEIPIEARIIAVADVYDALTSDRPYRKAMSPYEARETVAKGAGTEFDPKVVDAFQVAFRKGEMELPAFVV